MFINFGLIIPIFLLSINLVYTNSNYFDKVYASSPLEEDQSNSVECGSIVHEDILLTSDLDCVSDGLIILSEDGLTIDLNGYSIIGPGEKSGKIGIFIKDSENVQINGLGTVENYQNAISIETSMGIDISGLNFQDNELGVFYTNAKNSKLSDSTFLNNAIGTATNTVQNIILNNNTYNSNDLAGITLVNSGENNVSGNDVTGSVNGIFLDGQSKNNIIESNKAFENRGVDLNNGNGLAINVNENKFENNKCDTSVPPELCVR